VQPWTRTRDPQRDWEEAMVDVGGRMTEVTLDLFKSMMGLPVSEGPMVDLPKNPEDLGMDIVAFIGISGSRAGMVGVYSSGSLARRIAGALLGETPAEVNDEVRDGFGEVANIVAGNLVTWLCDMGESVQLSLPSVIVGRGLVTSILDSVPPRRARRFTVDGESLYVELALRSD
jgi:chemotaxis protein CheX